ncbi:MAG TPA: calcium-binding protein [Coleofasciculaceae cyanobacterium]|jgi:Ca2+-binding RTX toxin-like protein
MSEVIIQANTQGTTQFGLQVINEQPATLSQDSATTPVIVTGGGGTASFRVTSAETTTAYRVQTGSGNNTVVTGAAEDTLFGGIGSDTLDGGASNDRVNGGAGNDSLLGGAGNDTLYGNAGNDSIEGGLGNDTVNGGPGNDTVSSGAGNDSVLGAGGNDVLRGDAGNDTLRGGAGNDSLVGGSNNDVLIPGSGRDTLNGGGGNDRFRFEGDTRVGNSSQLNRVAGFSSGGDVIEISRRLLPGSGLRPGVLSEDDFQIVNGIGSSDSSAKIVYDSGTGILYYNPSQEGAENVPLLQLNGSPNVSAEDFRLF